MTPADLGEPDHQGVWAQHVAAVDAFLVVCTQWREVTQPQGPARVGGLDYQAARAGLEMAGIEITPDDFNRLRIIESGAVAALNERRGLR